MKILLTVNTSIGRNKQVATHLKFQEEVVLIHFDLLRSTLDRYLKKHSFCTECTNMVNRAFNILIKPDDDCAATPEVVTSSCQAGSVCSDQVSALPTVSA